eukprot:scaffold23896_cov170-Amphora_coffeaeformis.AAC.1
MKVESWTAAMMMLSRAACSRALQVAPVVRMYPRRAIFYGTSTHLWANQARQEMSSMENLYKEWTLQEDETLWKYRNESIDQIASRLGRGLRGVEKRLSKLKDVKSSAYQRLFVDQNDNAANKDDDDDDKNKSSKAKLLPAGEVLRRIKWDYQLDENDFSILHYDRMEDKIMESPFTARNNDIAGSETQLIDALPEHRIVGIKYKERVVWDREERLDLVFGPPGIMNIMGGYDTWLQRQNEEKEFNRRRQAEVSLRLQKVLGTEKFDTLKDLSASLRTGSKEATLISKKEFEDYVEKSIHLFRSVRADPSSSPDPTIIPMNDYDALDMLSELVALMPDQLMRASVLTEISMAMRIVQGKKVQIPKNRELPHIAEDDLTETFVRGSGPGGQKINKTSNRVVLVHNPTQLRVEVQDTRELQQNRKIARRRLREKLDEFLNGKQSKAASAVEKAVSKKAKAKARSKARQRHKQESKKNNDDSDNE